jgi:hypothetical protein
MEKKTRKDVNKIVKGLLIKPLKGDYYKPVFSKHSLYNWKVKNQKRRSNRIFLSIDNIH